MSNRVKNLDKITKEVLFVAVCLNSVACNCLKVRQLDL